MVCPRPARCLVAPAGGPDPVRAPIVVTEVPRHPPSEARGVPPAIEARRPGDGADDGGDAATDHAEPGVDLADVVEQRRREPSLVPGELGARQLLVDEPGDADRVALLVARQRAPQLELVRFEDARHPRRVLGARRPRPQRPGEASCQVQRSDPGHRTMKSNRASMNGENRRPNRFVERPTSRSTRIPYGRKRYHPGSHSRGSTRSMSEEPSRGGIGSRLNKPRIRLASAKNSRIWIASGRSATRNASPV